MNAIYFLGTAIDGDASVPMCAKQTERNYIDRNGVVPSSSNQDEISRLPLPRANAQGNARDKESQHTEIYNPSSAISPLNIGIDTHPLIVQSDSRVDSHLLSRKPGKELELDVEDLDIPWTDLVLKEKIGAGNPFFC